MSGKLFFFFFFDPLSLKQTLSDQMCETFMCNKVDDFSQQARFMYRIVRKRNTFGQWVVRFLSQNPALWPKGNETYTNTFDEHEHNDKDSDFAPALSSGSDARKLFFLFWMLSRTNTTQHIIARPLRQRMIVFVERPHNHAALNVNINVDLYALNSPRPVCVNTFRAAFKYFSVICTFCYIYWKKSVHKMIEGKNIGNLLVPCLPRCTLHLQYTQTPHISSSLKVSVCFPSALHYRKRPWWLGGVSLLSLVITNETHDVLSFRIDANSGQECFHVT